MIKWGFTDQWMSKVKVRNVISIWLLTFGSSKWGLAIVRVDESGEEQQPTR
ncbi:hypothetical protein LCGC14_0264110 [marine sediment metagenome]|uniref:Uncharacterized protein n=1 Tax=marine sediment metagenome TaxID=412755 RepID=A0A0F9UHP2_9ZZZZ